MKTINLKKQKEQLLEQRREVSKHAAMQKSQINEAFDKMKAKGKMDPHILEKLGLSTTASNIDAATKSRF